MEADCFWTGRMGLSHFHYLITPRFTPNSGLVQPPSGHAKRDLQGIQSSPRLQQCMRGSVHEWMDWLVGWSQPSRLWSVYFCFDDTAPPWVPRTLVVVHSHGWACFLLSFFLPSLIYSHVWHGHLPRSLGSQFHSSKSRSAHQCTLCVWASLLPQTVSSVN